MRWGKIKTSRFNRMKWLNDHYFIIKKSFKKTKQILYWKREPSNRCDSYIYLITEFRIEVFWIFKQLISESGIRKLQNNVIYGCKFT